MTAGKELFRIVGANSAIMYYGRRFWVVRYLEGDRDQFHRNAVGELVETKPWRRRLEIIGAGATIDECLWQLRGGIVRAMVGRGFTPVADQRGEWVGFLDDRKKPVQGGQLLFSAPSPTA